MKIREEDPFPADADESKVQAKNVGRRGDV